MGASTHDTISLVVLDLAGTTVKDDGLVLECFSAAASAVGLSVTREEINARMGLSKLEVFDELARRQLGDSVEASALRDEGYRIFTRVLETSYEKGGVAPIPGTAETFAWLRERRIKIALNTGFYRRVTDLIVDHLGWRGSVDAVVCGDDVVEGRPAPYMIHRAMELCRAPSVHEVAVVGDTPSDMFAGRRAGARAIVGVTSGAHPGSTLRRAPSTHVIDSVRGLPELLERIERLS